MEVQCYIQLPTLLIYIIPDCVPAYETIWIIGHDFVSNTAGEYLQSSEDQYKPYLRERYDVNVLCSNSLSLNRLVTA